MVRHSYRLLDVPMPPSKERIALFEEIMRELLLASGVYRTTFRGRFDNMDPLVNAALRRRFAPDAPLAVEDWAASDCLTSAEWARTLFAAFPQARLAASDLTMYILEATLDSGSAYIVERDGAGLQYLRGESVVSLNLGEPKSRPVAWIRCQWAKRVLPVRWKRWAAPEAWLDAPDPALALPGVRLRKISVVHPEARSLAAADPRFTLRRHSAFEATADPVDVVRSMNIFNKAYFAPARLAEGARAAWRSLRPGGLWIIGRTYPQDPPTHNTTLFERTASGFRVLERFGDGSEIEALVLEQRSS